MAQGPPAQIEQEPKRNEKRERLMVNPYSLAMATLLDRVAEVFARRTHLVYCSGPYGMGKTELCVNSGNGYVGRLKNLWEGSDDDQKLMGAYAYLTKPGSKSGELEFQSPFVRFPQLLSPPKFFELLKRSSHPGQVGLIDDPKMGKENESMLMGATGGDSYFARSHMNIKDKDAGAYHNGALILLDNYNPDARGINPRQASREVYTNREALEDRAGAGRLIMPFARPVLWEYILLTAFPDDEEYLGEWKKIGLFKYLYAPRNEKSKADDGLGFTGPEAQAIDMVEDVRDWFKNNGVRIRRLSYRTVRGLLKSRFDYPDRWKDQHVSSGMLSPRDLPWE